jgi:hypothetical protein
MQGKRKEGKERENAKEEGNPRKARRTKFAGVAGLLDSLFLSPCAS